jgi:hypothetical protein
VQRKHFGFIIPIAAGLARVLLFLFKTKGVYSTLQNKPRSKPRTFGLGKARKQPRKTNKTTPSGDGQSSTGCGVEPECQKGD